MLERQGIVNNQKNPRRLYAEEKLQVRKRAAAGSSPLVQGERYVYTAEQMIGVAWTSCAMPVTDGRRFRVLAVVDDVTRRCLAFVADTSLSGLRVTRELDDLICRCGKPTIVVSDNGTELTRMAVLKWRQETHFGWH